jgi:hypothetical protein
LLAAGRLIISRHFYRKEEMKMSLYKMYKTDAKKETEGIVVEYGTDSKGNPVKFRVARGSKTNMHYQTILERETRPYRRLIQGDKLKKETENKLNILVFVKALLLGWENVENENNEPMEFNQDNAIKLFTDLPDLFTELQTTAMDGNNFREEALEEEAKN